MKPFLKIFLIILTLLTLAWATWLLIAGWNAPRHYWSDLDTKIAESPQASRTWALSPRLVSEMGFLESRVDLMASDSISLVVDLKDTLMWLEMKGISFHPVKITRANLPKALDKLDAPRIRFLFGSPSLVSQNTSTIEREPITVIQAPKDTIEAAQNIFTPDTTMNHQTIFSYLLSNGISLVVTGWDENHPVINRVKFNAGKHIRYLGSLMTSRWHRDTLPYHPVIHLTIPSREAMVIYRALPQHPKVVIRMPDL